MRALLSLLLTLPLLGQTSTTSQSVLTNNSFTPTVPIELIVNWPPHQLVTQKYGPIPKWAMFGELIGCNKGATGVTYGQGDVIALLRSVARLQAFSIEDALLLVQNSQNDSKLNRAKAWLSAAANTAVQSKAAGIIGGGSATGTEIVIGAEAVNIFLPNLQGALSLKQVITYAKDGLQNTMRLEAGRCTVPYSVLFANPGTSPAPSAPIVMQKDIPADR